MRFKLENVEDPKLKARLQKALSDGYNTRKDADNERHHTDSSEGNAAVSEVGRHTDIKNAQRCPPACILRPVHLKFIHFRHRTPDTCDAIFVKWAIDSLVEAKVLQDDSSDWLPKKYEEEFVKVPASEEERTVVEIYET